MFVIIEADKELPPGDVDIGGLPHVLKSIMDDDAARFPTMEEAIGFLKAIGATQTDSEIWTHRKNPSGYKIVPITEVQSFS